MVSFQKKILIFRLGSLGDTVMALPAFHKIHDTFPEAEVTLLTNHPVNTKAAPLESILGSGYFFNSVLNYPIGTRNPFVLYKLLKDIRALKIDTLIYLTSARKLKTFKDSKLAVMRDAWFFKAAGVKNIIGLPENKNDFEVCIDENTGHFEWEAKRLARRMMPLGEIPLESDHYWDLQLTNEELTAAEHALEQFVTTQPILAISTGTKRQSNDWEEDNWLKLIQQLSLTLKGWQLIVLGATEEFERAEKCLKAWGQTGINLCGQTSPRVSGAILKKAEIFIGHDSGPMHLAACVGTPCVAIFSARNFPGQWFPRGKINKIIYHTTDCAGCGLEICIQQKKKCILSITVNEVQNAVMEIINGSKIQNVIH